jgi:hypothetical protein
MEGKMVILPLVLTEADVSLICNFYRCWNALHEYSHSLLSCAPYCFICRAMPWLRLLIASL